MTPAEEADPLNFDEDETPTNGNGASVAAPPPAPPPPKTTTRVSQAAGGIVKETLTREASIPIGQFSPVSNERIGGGPAHHGTTPAPGGAGAAREFLRRASEEPSEQKRTAAWTIRVRRLAPLMYKGVPLNTTEDIACVSIMPASDVEGAVKSSHGGGRYKADVVDGAGIWQMSWQFAFSESNTPPVAPAGGVGGIPGTTPSNDPLHLIAVEERRRKMEMEEREFNNRLKREEEEREERKRKQEKAERDAEQQNPLMQALIKMQEDANRRFEMFMEKVMNKPPDTSNAEMLKIVLASLEAKKDGANDQVEIAKINAEAQKEAARLNAENAKAVAESTAKIQADATQRADRYMEMLFKSDRNKPSGIAEMKQMMDFVDAVRNRFTDEVEPQSSGLAEMLAPLATAAVPKLAEWLGGFVRPGTPSHAAAAQIMGTPAGQQVDLQRFAESLLPHLQRAVNRPQQPALPSAGTLKENPDGTATISVEPPAPAQAQGPAPSPAPVPVDLDITAETGTTKEERRRERIQAALALMMTDAADRVAEASWTEDALASWGDLLDEISAVPYEECGKIIERYADPVAWKKFLDLMHANHPGAYATWSAGLKSVVNAHRTRVARIQAQARPVG